MHCEPSNPWERQSGESGRAYEAFALYRDMGVSRTLAAVGRQLSKSMALIDRWRARWNWHARALAYDKEIEEQARKQVIKDKKKMLARHVKIAMQVQSKALEALEKMDASKMTPRDIKEYIRMATELERLSRMFEETDRKNDDALDEGRAITYDLSAYSEETLLKLVRAAYANKDGETA